ARRGYQVPVGCPASAVSADVLVSNVERPAADLDGKAEKELALSCHTAVERPGDGREVGFSATAGVDGADRAGKDRHHDGERDEACLSKYGQFHGEGLAFGAYRAS